MNKILFTLEKAAPSILTVASSLGVIGTGVLSAYCDRRYRDICENEKPETTAEKIKCAGKAYWPAGLCVVVTIGGIFLVRKADKKVIMAMAGLAAAHSAKFGEYREAVKNEAGEEKEKEIYENTCKIDQTDLIFEKEEENDLKVFRDSISGEFFLSTPARVESALYYLNKLLLEGFSVTENDYRFCLGLKKRKDFDEEGLLHDGSTVGWGVTYFIEYYKEEPHIDHFIKAYRNSKGLEYHEITFAHDPCEEALEMECKDM